ncbi:MAG: 4Fe-4S binding protein [Pseudodesulfovibrio sp.]|nr:4Fe-4S binding protein [Pseudodesulfovibrio sp.]
MLFTPTVIKNLLKKPVTRKYPYEVREPFPNFRGELVIDIDQCIFCGMCVRKCPCQCIEVDKEAGTWACDLHECISCGYCRDHCPTKCLSMKDTHRKPLLEKTTWIEQGTPPKPKKKVEAPKAETKVEAKKEKPEVEKKAAPQKGGKK